MKIQAYKMSDRAANLQQTKITRDWMDETTKKHAYRCYPVSVANSLGWSLSYDMDISFIWDGVSDTTPDHVTVLSGIEVCSTGRANATISFDTGIIFKTDPNVTLVSIAPPNYFIEGAQAFTSVISTSFFNDVFPCAWKITKPDTVITIPAGTPVATILPVSLGALSEVDMSLHSGADYLKANPTFYTDRGERSKEFAAIVQKGEWPGFYRDAVDHNGNSVGTHEVSHLKLNVTNHTEQGHTK
jgi:Family of unknown function (DUF6065)